MGKDDTQELVRTIQSFTHLDYHTVFSDFVEMAALSVARAFEVHNPEHIDGQMKGIQKKYKPQEIERFGNMFGMLVMAMERYAQQGRYVDVLARVFNALEIQNKNAAQFFTPTSVAKLTARMSFDPVRAKETIEKEGYITCNEPAVGGGVMVLEFAEAMRAAGFNPSKQLLIYAGDIDRRCVCMSYLHFSLYGLPAVLDHADTLSLMAWQRWYSPVYVLDLWCFKDRRGRKRNG